MIPYYICERAHSDFMVTWWVRICFTKFYQFTSLCILRIPEAHGKIYPQIITSMEASCYGGKAVDELHQGGKPTKMRLLAGGEVDTTDTSLRGRTPQKL